MRATRKYFFISVVIVCQTLLSAGSRAQTGVTSEEGPGLLIQGEHLINGVWQLNPDESDDVMNKINELLSAEGQAPRADAEQTKQPSLSISLFPPEDLTIAVDEGNRISISEGFQYILQTRTLVGDGQVRTAEISPGASFSVKAEATAVGLTIETISPRGNRMIEFYETVPDSWGDKLKVTIRIDSPSSQELLTLHRMYDRLTTEMPRTEGVY